MYKNSEGYSDPTVGVAISSIMKEHLQIRKKVYVAFRYAGDIEAKKLGKHVRFVKEVV